MENERVQDKYRNVYTVVSQSSNEHPDETVSNKWRWNWLLGHDRGPSKDLMSAYLWKIDVEGQAFCRWCKIKINYGPSGKKACYLHASNTRITKSILMWWKSKGVCHLCTVLLIHTPSTLMIRLLLLHLLNKRFILLIVWAIFKHLLFPLYENNLPFSMVLKLIEFGKIANQD